MGAQSACALCGESFGFKRVRKLVQTANYNQEFSAGHGFKRATVVVFRLADGLTIATPRPPRASSVDRIRSQHGLAARANLPHRVHTTKYGITGAPRTSPIQ